MIVRVAAGLGFSATPPALNTIVMVMVPAVVPVWNAIVPPAVAAALVCPAGMEKVMVVCPLANTTAGSTGPEAGLKVKVAVPVRSRGYAWPNVTPKAGGGRLADVVVSESWVTLTVGSAGGAMLMVKARVALRGGWALSETRIVKLKAPGLDGVPPIAPLVALSESPSGNPPLATANE